MICILAGNLKEAQMWASGQLLDDHEWFYPKNEADLYSKTNFHVIVVGTAGLNLAPTYFEKILSLAKQRGNMK